MRLPRVRVSVRAMMALVLLVGCASGWLVRRAHLQRDSVAEIRRAGGILTFDDDVDAEGFNRAISERTRPPVQRWLMTTLGDDYVRRVRSVWLISNRGERPREETWHSLTNLHDLVHVRLIGVDVDDEHLARFERLTDLRCLDVSDSGRITNAGLARIAGLHRLRVLELQGTRVDDAGLVHLAGLTRIQRLNLNRTGVTDAGLRHLAGMSNLEQLFVEGTKVTADGVAEFRRAHPRAEVFR